MKTGGLDWRLAKVRIYRNEEWYYRYLWIGPEATSAYHICLGTEDSIHFLEFIEKLHAVYRDTAYQLDHSGIELPTLMSEEVRSV